MAKYLRKKCLLDQLGDLPGNRLDALVLAGAIRTVKFGSHRQSPRLYSLQDAEAALEQLANGKRPSARRRQ